MDKPAIRIIDALGVDRLKAFGFTERNIRRFRETGRFPAKYWPGLRDLCADAGLYCPEDAFTWSRPITTKRGGANAAIQDREGV